MDKLAWCKRQKSGIQVVEKNQNLCYEYFQKAENALKAIKSLDGNNEWQISSAYYSMYFSVYAVMMKMGIKCEIHACTIEIMKEFFKCYFSADDIMLLQSSLAARIDAQYYTDRHIQEQQRKNMVEAAPKFHLKCRDISIKLTNKEIDNVRSKLK